jgi:hypothetical protein
MCEECEQILRKKAQRVEDEPDCGCGCRGQIKREREMARQG